MTEPTRTMTLAEFRAAHPDAIVAPKRKRTTRKALPRAGARSRCARCGEEFTTDAGQDRHRDATGHGRYECVIDEQETA